MNVVILSLIGALLLLDKYAFGEFGFSQPIISGTIIGAIFGDITGGIYIGAMLQLIFLGGLPIGGDIPPDGQAAGVIGCGSFFLLQTSNTPQQVLFLAVMLALVGSIIGATLDIYTRRMNEKLYHLFEKKERLLYLCHFAGLATAFIRGFCLFLPIFLFANLFVIPSFFPILTKELLTIIGISLGLANSIYFFAKKPVIIYLLCGVICSLVLRVL